MAKTNDKPEFHSVKVFVTENIPTRHRHLSVTVGTDFIPCLTGYFARCFISRYLPLPFDGGQAHV
ncbi:hypothetical protein SG34_023380 [Thalassomonas viridans]|uniref:Uncharacterized protein n=1 Tax=Thalassomonas viridans TaxID=137584 RepID=A0AAE9Z2Z0_9GAMM|nr:hypothetical protein [Thalassomonas viridans]WDE04253.1 hypothetical protein SG34_023380 [Thalassomonas viridans]